jgi:vacuolar-type H+-ATPase subunit I/STV1
MSGYKYSEVILERERETKLKLLSNIDDVKRRLSWLAGKISETLERTPEGIKATFDREVKESIIWLSDEGQRRRGAYDVGTDISTLRSELASLNALAERGQRTLNALTISFTKKADALEKTLFSTLSQIEGMYYSCKELLETWFGQDTISECEKSLGKARQLLEKRQLSELGKYLEDIERTLSSRIQEAQELEYKHQKRLYVLKALRQVCKEMGFEESEPKYEREGKKNRIVYEVDTMDQGRIRFFLSLEGISTHSGIAEDRCLDEFDKLSHFLEQEFGVKTKFRLEGEKPDEKLMHKGEIDLPEGTHIERTV